MRLSRARWCEKAAAIAAESPSAARRRVSDAGSLPLVMMGPIGTVIARRHDQSTGIPPGSREFLISAAISAVRTWRTETWRRDRTVTELAADTVSPAFEKLDAEHGDGQTDIQQANPLRSHPAT